MPLSFPSSPSVNQTSTQNGRVYRWSGLAWEFDSFTTAADDARWSLFLPPAPTNVTASAGNGQASVSWAAPSVLSVTPVTDYLVQYSSNSGSTWTTFSDGTSTSTSATVTGLTNGTAYVFRVAAVNGVGTGPYSASSSAITPTVTPAGDPLWSSVRLLVPFNDTTADVGPSSLTATGGNAPTYVAGKYGNAAQFNGTDFNRWANYATAAITGDLTLECWLQPPSNGLYYGKEILTLGNVSSGLYLIISSRHGPNLIRFDATDVISEDSFSGNITAGALPTGVWTHIALVRQGVTLRAYVDGVQTATSVMVSPPSLSSLKVSSQGSVGERFIIDDLRLTAAARYPDGTTFTPPTAAFPIA